MADPEDRAGALATREGDGARDGEDAEGRPAIAADAPGAEPISRRQRRVRIAVGAAIGALAAAMLAGAFASDGSSREREVELLWACQSFDGGSPQCGVRRETDGNWLRPPPRGRQDKETDD